MENCDSGWHHCYSRLMRLFNLAPQGLWKALQASYTHCRRHYLPQRKNVECTVLYDSYLYTAITPHFTGLLFLRNGIWDTAK